MLVFKKLELSILNVLLLAFSIFINDDTVSPEGIVSFEYIAGRPAFAQITAI